MEPELMAIPYRKGAMTSNVTATTTRLCRKGLQVGNRRVASGSRNCLEPIMIATRMTPYSTTRRK